MPKNQPMRFSRSIPFYIVAITTTALVTEAPAKAEDAYTVKILTTYRVTHGADAMQYLEGNQPEKVMPAKK